MLTQVAGPLRVARAGLVATLVLALAALAHRVGGGTLPHPLILLALASFTLAGTMLAARLRFTVGRLVVVLGAGQVGLHHALGFLGRATCAPVASGHAGHAAVPAACPAPPALPDAVAHLPHAAPGGQWMLLAHALATLVVALVVARGERALGLLLTWLAPRARLTDLLPALPARPRLQAPAAAPSRATNALWRRPSTRGPPVRVRPVVVPS
ncbi:hypothetical protein [Oerskovia turbata]